MKLPFIKFFPRDWQADSNLRMCSLEARGLWFEMLCIMAQAPRYGYLVNGDGSEPLSDDALTRLMGCSKDDLYRARLELEKAGVPSIDQQTGAWFNRRMARDEEKRRKCSAAGKAGGGNPALREERKEEYQKPEARSHISINPTFIGDESKAGSFPDGGWTQAQVIEAAGCPTVAMKPQDAAEYHDTRCAAGWIDAAGRQVARTIGALKADLRKWKRGAARRKTGLVNTWQGNPDNPMRKAF